MSIEIGGEKKTKVRPQMNLTPLIDVVLVLLIIFMVVTPLLTKQFWITLPKEEKQAQREPDPSSKPIVLFVSGAGEIKINTEVVARDQLKEKLRRVFAANSHHMLFVTAAEDAPYGVVVEAMDIARAGGAVTISVITEKPKS